MGAQNKQGKWSNRVVARMRNAPRLVSVPVGVAFIMGGTILSPLPVFGIWMVPIGLVIMAPHVPAAGRFWRRMLRFSLRHKLIRIKRTPLSADQPSPPSEG